MAVNYDKDEPWKTVPIIAKTEEEIIECAGSKYCYVNYGRMPLQLDQNYSVLVGLPCQIPKNKGCFRIGLFCGLNTTEEKLNYLLKWNGISKGEIIRIDWRSPKNRLLEIQTRCGEIYYLEHWFLNFFFPRPNCLRCSNYSNHNADISVGDRQLGKSVLIARTDEGLEVLTKAISAEYINAEEISFKSFVDYRMSPMLQKELRGGYVNIPFIRFIRGSGKWINKVPPVILKFIGLRLASYTKRISKKDIAFLTSIEIMEPAILNDQYTRGR